MVTTAGLPAETFTRAEAIREAGHCFAAGVILGACRERGCMYPLAALRRMVWDVTDEDFEIGLAALAAGGLIAVCELLGVKYVALA